MMIKNGLIIFLLAIGIVLFAQPEDKTNSQNKLVFEGSFEGDFNNPQWVNKWGIAWNSRADECSIVSDAADGDKALQVFYPEGSVGPDEGGAQFPIVFRNMQQNEGSGLYHELYLRYYVKFEEGFDFQRGGKLPGLMGGGDSWARSGGHQPDGTNGWTLRLMWRQNRRLVVYAYVPPSENGKWGSETWGQDIDSGVDAETGEWMCIEQFVNVGNAGKDNGRLKVWIDGEECISINDMRFGDVENDDGKIG
ncbi:MAG TPA: hypothetical protein VJ909_03070, partial [Prolixibacteraceae bacterium]|nr:hypothetical protein [Prolixibacteraceae bacterium]